MMAITSASLFSEVFSILVLLQEEEVQLWQHALLPVSILLQSLNFANIFKIDYFLKVFAKETARLSGETVESARGENQKLPPKLRPGILLKKTANVPLYLVKHKRIFPRG